MKMNNTELIFLFKIALEDIPIVERYKTWLDEVSKLFGGLDFVAIGKKFNN